MLVIGLAKFHFSNHWIINGDALQYYAQIRSLVFDGDIDYENEFTDFNPHNHITQLADKNPDTGRVPNKYTLGTAILWAPFYGLSHLAVVVFDLESGGGYGFAYQLAILLASILYALLGLFFCLKLLNLFVKRKSANLAIASFFIGSNLLYYVVIEPGMAHTVSFSMVSGYLYLAIKYFEKKKPVKIALALGFFAAMMILVRPQNVFFVILSLVELFSLISRKRAIPFNYYLIASAMAVTLFLPQLFYWKELYGSYFAYSYSGETFVHWYKPNIIGVLLSKNSGYFYWNPIHIIGVLGLALFFRKNKQLATILVVLLLVQIYLLSAWHCWWLGDSFGYRGLISCASMGMLGLALCLEKINWERKKVVVLSALSIFGIWNILLMFQYAKGWISHDGPVGFAEIFTNHFRMVKYLIKLLF